MFFPEAKARQALLALSLLAGLLLAACSPERPVQPATSTPVRLITPYRTPTPSRTPTAGLPVTGLATPPPEPSPTPITYVVVSGETMLGIALRFGISLEDLMAANTQVDPHFLSVGTELVIPLGEAAPPALASPTPVDIPVSEPVCYPTADGGAWCFLLVRNNRSRPLENVSARIGLFSPEGDLAAEATAIAPLNLIPGDSDLPLAAFFEAPLPERFLVDAALLTGLPVSRSDPRYLKTDLEVTQVEVSPDGLQATVDGQVALARGSSPANQVWLAAVAYGAQGEVAGVRKWQAVYSPAPAGAGTAQPSASPGVPSPTALLTVAPPANQPALQPTQPVPGATTAPESSLTESSPPGQLSSTAQAGPLQAGESLPFAITVFSLGPAIERVEVLVEARP